jgi:hypothetical protein|tara:strand:- start:1242 stop:1691 length:450 start_codon:yes stop_codon:yes gene_type:complete
MFKQTKTRKMSHLISSKALFNVLRAEKKNNGSDFTIKSIISGKDYTYKICRSEFNGKWYTHVKVESGYMSFIRLGSYYNGNIYNKRQEVLTPSAVAIAWVLQKVEQQHFDLLDSKIEVMHTGSCLRCGKTLTDAVSISRGLGDVCASGV